MVSSYLLPLIVLVSLSIPSIRGMNRRPSETLYNQMVTGTLCILYNDSMADNIILIIDYIPPLLVRSGWDNGSIEKVSQRWCVFLCRCIEINYALQQKNSHIWSGTLLMVRANVCAIHNWPELFVYVYRVLALWTGWCINIMAYRLPYTHYHGGIDIEIHMHRIHNYGYIYMYLYSCFFYQSGLCAAFVNLHLSCRLHTVGWHIWISIDVFGLCVSSLVINLHTPAFVYTCIIYLLSWVPLFVLVYIYIYTYIYIYIYIYIHLRVFCMFIHERMCVGVYLLEYNQLGI